MYFPVGWSKVLNVPNLNTCSIRQILCNRDKILFAILTDDTLSIYFGKPCLPIVLHRRTQESIEDIGTNESVQWRPDSSSICVATSGGYLIIYKLHVGNEQKGLYQLVDSPQPNLRRDSAELFIKEVIPSLQLTLQHRMYEYKFYLYYRMSVASFDELLGAVCDKIRRSGTVMKRSIEPAERLVITLSATKMLIWELPNREKDSILFFQEKNILQINRKCTSFHEMKLYLGASILWKNKKRMKHKCLSIMEAEFRLMIFLWLSLFVGAIGFSDILAKTCKVFVDKQGAEHEVAVGGGILSMVCIRDELMLATTRGHVVRYRWDGTENRDYCLDLRRVPFCIDQQVAKAVPIVENNTYIIDMEYSPLIGGFAIVLNDGRAAFLTSSNLMFDPNQVQGIWAQNIDDATCATVNHKYRLITFGRKNSQAAVFEIDEVSGGLEMTHQLIVSSQVYPGDVGAVTCLRWTPDGCAVAMAWANGGFSLWSTFGSLLVCSLAWDYGLHVDLAKYNPLTVHAMEWSSEGYQLWMVKKSGCGGDYVHSSNANNNYCNSQNNSNCDFNRNCNEDSLIQLGFVKSALTVNPCMSHQAHLYLQGEDRLYVNLGAGLTKVYHIKDATDSPSPQPAVTTSLVESKTWIVILIPSTYSATNWPIKYTAIDSVGCHLAVAGRSGLAHYSLLTRKWKLFGNETQEKDMVVTGGLLWWDNYIVAGCYNLPDNQDEIRIYSRDTRLSNECMTSTQVSSQLLLLDSVRDRLLVFCADSFITIYVMTHISNGPSERSIGLNRLQIINISALRVHPACVVSVTLQTEPGRRDSTYGKDSFLLNVSGRLLSVHQHNNNQSQVLAAPTVLASCVENVWVPSKFCRNKPHLTEALWLFCGSHGMRVWLPLFPRDGHKGHGHTFMSKRVMLPFHLKIYPLAILFEDAILLGAENDTVLYSSDSSSPFSLPFCTLERTSQVYLHQILRQLIRRNLGFHAWEIARCCTGLPYFSHSLELLLHEVLEEEATSKEPIPDAQLPSVVEFIQEFPVYLETVVQCARKTEIALWPYLFSAAGKPKDLFQECLARKQLETAASYLIILQNLESSTVSRQYATILLDSTLENGKWELSKDLVRFLKAIDPNDVESPRTSFIMPSKYGMMPQSPPVAPNEEDLSLVLGSMQVSRGRSFSTTVNPKIQSVDTPQSGSATAHHIDISTQRRKKSVPTGKSDNRDSSVSSSVGCGSDSAEEFFMDVVIQRHARRLLCQHQLSDLGRMSAHLYFPLVGWLARERQRAARVDAEHFVAALRHLHSDFSWPYPQLLNNTNTNAPPNQTKGSVTSGSSLRSSPTIEERVKGVDDVTTLDSRVGDSGYMSQDPLFPLRLPYCTQPIPGDDRSIISENESWYYDNDMEAVSNETWNVIPSVQLLEQVNLQISQYNKGSSKSEVQLRYLLQIFLEAGCLEWSLLIAVLLQDAMAAHRTTTIAARSPDQTYEAINRLKEGIIALFQWSATECYGYKPFMMVIQSQVVVLNRFLTTKQRSATPPPDTTSHPPQQTRSRTSSCTYDGGGAGVGGGASQSQPTAASVTPTEQQSAESAVSQLEESRPHSPLPSHFNQVTEQSSCTIS